MTKSWTSGDKGSEAVDKLRTQVTEIERKLEELVEKNERQVFDWASFVLGSPTAPATVRNLRDHQASQEIKDVIALYDLLRQQLLDKEAMLNEKLDEQARYDSLG